MPRFHTIQTQNTARDYIEIGAAFVIIIGLLFALGELDLLPRTIGLSDTMSYGLVFIIGLVASVSSCIAVTGGLLVASVVMILLGLQMLRLLPAVTRLLPTMPKAFGHFIHDLAERDANGGAFLLGAATFFLPCGFTQALQLYVLAKASFAVGALTMLAFSLGTLPALASLSAMSSFATGTFQRHFLKFAGAAAIVLGIANIQYGLVLSGSDLDAASVATNERPAGVEPQTAVAAQMNGKQVVVMRIEGYNYIPSRFTVKEGIPVEWRIDASEAAGCGRILIAAGLGVRRLLPNTSTTMISFMPPHAGEFGFNCGMGMMTPGSKFTVVPSERG